MHADYFRFASINTLHDYKQSLCFWNEVYYVGCPESGLWKSGNIENNTWAWGDIWNFSLSVQLDFSQPSTAMEWDIKLHTKREIPYLQETMYYFVHYINILLTRISWLHSLFKKRMRYHSLMALNRASDMSPADLKNVKSCHHFSRVVRQFFSETPRLYNKISFSTFEFSLFSFALPFGDSVPCDRSAAKGPLKQLFWW